MPDRTRCRCRHCHRHQADVGPISWSGACIECARELLIENIDSNITKSGRFYARRQYGMVRAELGPRVALALKKAGYFGTALDDLEGAA